MGVAALALGQTGTLAARVLGRRFTAPSGGPYDIRSKRYANGDVV